MGTVLKPPEGHSYEHTMVDFLTKTYEESRSLLKAPPAIILWLRAEALKTTQSCLIKRSANKGRAFIM